MENFTKKELALFKSLNTPRKIQEFITKIPINFEPYGETCLSPRMVLQQNRAHCIEAAMLAATILRKHGHRPLLLDLEACPPDDSHVVALFKQHGYWGAISKTNHAVLRYRDPIYKTIRELALSYFHEYFDKKGKKTLRAYAIVDLSKYDKKGWMTADEDQWDINNSLFELPHHQILNRKQIALLKKPDKIEMKYGDLVEWKRE
ncbi:hypothetical protein J4444_05135 [Candidatus Woesearchaeota archaeon]|nr:hypothetical protein [Candidatus Woesearchaeota archaeon]